MANYNIFKKGGLIVVIDANGNYFSEPANRVNIFKSTSSATAFSVFFTRYDPIINIPFANIVDENNWRQMSDDTELEKVVKQVISKNPKAVEDYKAGKQNAIQFLSGQVMAATRGTANPDKVRQLLLEILSK